jgi:hypothetical protein
MGGFKAAGRSAPYGPAPRRVKDPAGGARRPAGARHRTGLAPTEPVWNAFAVPFRHAAHLLFSVAILSLFALAAGARATAADDSPAPGTSPNSASDAQGFEQPVNIIPELGMWVDAIDELGGTKKSGLIVWWNLEKPRAGSKDAKVDWSRVTFRIRAEAFDSTGKKKDEDEKLVDPLHSGPEGEGGGFPAKLALQLKAGTYRVHLEAYPLISASAAGLDSVPRGMADAKAYVPELSHRRSGWSIGDPLFLESSKKWEPGSSDDRTWYEWIIRPNPSRTFSTQGKTNQLAFEVVRSFEPVPRCGANTCRVVITVNDAQGGIVLQELRPVPDPATSSAYLVPIDASGLAPGSYSVTIEIFEANEREAAIRREFSISS